ncbi:uncharacterized protein LOC123315974 [Coccinella septempunctata]|uniref:uncharacterized protein LOC123315974 n=1 Tax=Coccinella septempunctata TaxID=41139 RepID=UPI001D0968D5|nr:uncharacterized protein LOC123315974 [Coccinella septempunctata]
MNKREQGKILATEMEFWWRCAKKTRLDRIPNQEIRRRMSVEDDILTFIEEKRLELYGHVRRAPPDRWISRITEWSPLGRRRWGRPRRSFRDEVDSAMTRRNLEDGDWNHGQPWNDIDEWRNRLREGRPRHPILYI